MKLLNPVLLRWLYAILSLLIISANLQAQDPAMFQLVGFAMVKGSTTGGAGGRVIVVSTGADLQSALKAKQDEDSALVIMVEGLINQENSPGLSKIDVKDVKDVSIIGMPPFAEFEGIGVKIMRARNIIIRNLQVHHVLSGDKDCISIEGPADHIWVDHCELFNEYDGVDKDYYDGLLDAKAESEYLTYSWNVLHDSWKTALIGSSESDIFDRKLTMHHNYFYNCNSRLPLFRASTGHFFNNYFKDITSTVINTRINSCVRIEKNYFENAQNPWVSAYSDVLGGGEVIDNILVNSPFVYSSDTHEILECSPEIPYEYQSVLHDAASVPALVMEYAGVGKIPSGIPSREIVQESRISVYPNPAADLVTIGLSGLTEGTIEVDLIDLTGKSTIVFSGFVSTGGTSELIVNTGTFNPGIYILRVRTRQGIFTRPVVIVGN
jgi:pectate lyase